MYRNPFYKMFNVSSCHLKSAPPPQLHRGINIHRNMTLLCDMLLRQSVTIATGTKPGPSNILFGLEISTHNCSCNNKKLFENDTKSQVWPSRLNIFGTPLVNSQYKICMHI